MCDHQKVEPLEERIDTTVYVCLACGYRFALRAA